MTTQAEKAIQFRKLHESNDAFIIPNPWDQGSAKILASLGFNALATTSAGFAWSTGRKDVSGSVSRADALAHAADIAAACELPVSADLEDGFGIEPEQVGQTIAQAGMTGLVGASIEDATHGSVHDMALAVERVQAAVEAARAYPFPFTLTARAENYLCGNRDLDDTIKRLQAYETAGADVLYAPGLPDIDAIKQVCSSVAKPVNVVLGLGGSGITVAMLAQAGVRRISLGSSLACSAYGALFAAAQELQSDGTTDFKKTAATYPQINGLMS